MRFSSQAFYAGLLRDKEGNLSGGRRMLSGLAAGITEALLIITPLETCKVKLQAQRGLDKSQLKYKGPIHAASVILREEGVRGLWAGASATAARNGTNQVREKRGESPAARVETEREREREKGMERTRAKARAWAREVETRPRARLERVEVEARPPVRARAPGGRGG